MNQLRILALQEFERRRTVNPSYSLRGYAKWLGLNPTTLCLFLNGKRDLAKPSLEKILVKVGRSSEWLDAAKQPARQGASFTELAADEVRVISDWYYFAILSLAETRDFQDDPDWIAKRLNIQVRQARSALNRLERLELLARNKVGRLVPTGKSYKTPDQTRNLAVRKSHVQSLDLALASLNTDPVELRDFSAMTMAIDPAKLPEAKKRIQKFRRSLCNFLESSPKKEVYRLSLQLFPLSKDNV